MTQTLVFDVDLCTECRTCMLVCSFVHFSVFNPERAGVNVVSDWPDFPKIHVCRQCIDPACVDVCPVDALEVSTTGVVKVSHETCIGCGDCVDACPYGGVWISAASDTAVKCDTCDGRFECVESCFAGAISIQEVR